MAAPSEPVPVPEMVAEIAAVLGDLGVADRRADLAVATLSLSWNYGDSWEGELLDAYGVEPDATRIAYYRGSPSKLWAHWNAGDISSR